MWQTFVISPLNLAVKLHNLTEVHRKIIYEICGEKKTNFDSLSYIFLEFFLETGHEIKTVGLYKPLPVPVRTLIWKKLQSTYQVIA